MSGGVKFDGKKPTFDLLPYEAFGSIQRVMIFGAKKYGYHNWRGGFRWLRLWNAAMRHMWAWAAGERSDPETGESHLAHAACCLLFLLVHEIQGLGEDDRNPYLDVTPAPVAIAAEPPPVAWNEMPPYSEALDAA